MCLLQSNCQIVSISIWKLTTKLIMFGISDCFCRHITKLTSTGDLKQIMQGVWISTLALCYCLHPQISYHFVLSTINNGCIMTICSVQWHTVVWDRVSVICVYRLFFAITARLNEDIFQRKPIEMWIMWSKPYLLCYVCDWKSITRENTNIHANPCTTPTHELFLK